MTNYSEQIAKIINNNITVKQALLNDKDLLDAIENAANKIIGTNSKLKSLSKSSESLLQRIHLLWFLLEDQYAFVFQKIQDPRDTSTS